LKEGFSKNLKPKKGDIGDMRERRTHEGVSHPLGGVIAMKEKKKINLRGRKRGAVKGGGNYCLRGTGKEKT